MGLARFIFAAVQRLPLRYGIGFAALELVANLGCSKAPAPGQCELLFDHIVALELAAQHAPISAEIISAEISARNKTQLQDQERGEFVTRCEKNIKATQVTCALQASTIAALDPCDS